MDPTTVFCPNVDCPVRGQSGQGHIAVHSRRDQRYMYTQCHKTFTVTKGTVCDRLRTSAELVVTVVTWLAHGCPLQAIVAAFGLDERTVAAWWTRAGQQSQAVQEYLVEQPRDLGHVQADEIRVKTQDDIVWMALGMMVRPRLWRAGEVSMQRDMPLIHPLLVCTDGLCAYIRAIRETFRDPVHTGSHGRPRLRPWRNLCMAQVVKRYAQRRVVNVNFCTPHASLGHGERTTTPAMATGITDHCWSVRELLSYHVPSPRWTSPKHRGRPSHALKRLIERWCGNHG
jgi:transposase-like protein